MLATSLILSNAADADDDDAMMLGDRVTVYMFNSRQDQGCNDIHVSLKCVADVCGERAQ